MDNVQARLLSALAGSALDRIQGASIEAPRNIRSMRGASVAYAIACQNQEAAQTMAEALGQEEPAFVYEVQDMAGKTRGAILETWAGASNEPTLKAYII